MSQYVAVHGQGYVWGFEDKIEAFHAVKKDADRFGIGMTRALLYHVPLSADVRPTMEDGIIPMVAGAQVLKLLDLSGNPEQVNSAFPPDKGAAEPTDEVADAKAAEPTPEPQKPVETEKKEVPPAESEGANESESEGANESESEGANESESEGANESEAVAPEQNSDNPEGGAVEETPDDGNLIDQGAADPVSKARSKMRF